jgi:hypothetical protein
MKICDSYHISIFGFLLYKIIILVMAALRYIYLSGNKKYSTNEQAGVVPDVE